MDAFNGYNQISIHLDHHTKTVFITLWGNFVYTKMAFVLHNAPLFFKTMVTHTFGPTLLNFLHHVFRDDFSNFIGTRCYSPVEKLQEDLHQLALVFEKHRHVRLKLNPNKCQFLVFRGKILGQVVLAKGLTLNPDKVIAILYLSQPVNPKGTQSFVGHKTIIAISFECMQVLPYSSPTSLPSP